MIAQDIDIDFSDQENIPKPQKEINQRYKNLESDEDSLNIKGYNSYRGYEDEVRYRKSSKDESSDN